MAKNKVNWDVVGPKIKELIEERKLYKTQIANEVGIGTTTLNRYLNQEGLECKVSSNFWDTHIEELRDLLNQGYSYKEAAHHLGVSRDSVELIVNRRKLEYDKPIQSVLISSEVKIVKKMFEEGKTYREMSKSLPSKKSPQLISRFVRLYGVSYGFDTTKRPIEQLIEKPRIATKPSKKESEVLDYNSLGSANKHRFDALRKFLGRNPTRTELNTRYSEILTKEYITESLEACAWKLPETSELTGISPTVIHRLCIDFGIDQTAGKEKYLERQITELYILDDLSIPEIMEKLDLSENSIRAKIRKYIPGGYKDSDRLRSSGELMTISVLESLGIEFSEQVYYYDVAIGYRNFVKIDFEFTHNGINYWIEYNGFQHYGIEGFYGLSSNTATKEDFITLLNRDRCVREYAKNNGIVFIEIPYTVTSISKINKIITDFLETSRTDSIDLTDLYHKISEYGVNPID